MKPGFSQLLTRLIVAFLIATLAACGTTEQSSKPSTVPSIDKVNQSLETAAQLFAKSMTDEMLRLTIYRQVDKRFDGDTNVLYQTLAGQSDVTQQLTHAYNGSLTTQVSSDDSLETVENLIGNIPRLQIAVPTQFENWNPQAYTPLVGFAPVGVEDTTLKTIKAFDAQGNVYSLDAQTEPDMPVIILSVNERSDSQGNVLPEYSLDSSSSDNLTALGCKRVDMDKVKITNDYEPWAWGDPEIRLIARSRNAGGVSYHGGFSEVNDINLTYNYFRKIGCTGGSVVFFWYEDDANFSGSIEAKFRGVGLGMSYNEGDDVYGAIEVANGNFLNGRFDWFNLGDLRFAS